MTPYVSEVWDTLVDGGFATENELDLVFKVAGCDDDVADSVIYAITGCRNLEQLEDEYFYEKD